jgi:Glucodextranase, domain N
MVCDSLFDYVALWSDMVTRSCAMRLGIVAGVIVLVGGLATVAAVPAAHAQGSAPGEPGSAATWDEPSVTGFADSLGASSKVWYTIGNGELENAFYPETDTPDTYGLQYAVTNGLSFTELETTGTTHMTKLLSNNYLVWQQVNTADSSRTTWWPTARTRWRNAGRRTPGTRRPRWRTRRILEDHRHVSPVASQVLGRSIQDVLIIEGDGG